MKNIDFIERLRDKINALDLAIEARLDYLDEKEGLVIYALPGGKVEDEDLAGTQTVSLPYEIAIKSQDQALNNVILWQINAALSSFDLNLDSSNGSYTFLNLTVEAPSLNDLDEQGFYVYLLDVTARLEIERK
ncbi:minor capsid protein [Streptococcus hyointestinalis]|uniref:minor capsid protein n=1 Tax=Streptococcus hyointestinalis TaxID=1337 RepID=UPI0013DE8ED5|nr:minor capsid protein [Streptococcus hyointestinalis]